LTSTNAFDRSARPADMPDFPGWFRGKRFEHVQEKGSHPWAGASLDRRLQRRRPAAPRELADALGVDLDEVQRRPPTLN